MNLVLVSSAGRCGINEYTMIMHGGFEANGHRVRHIGVERHDKDDLQAKLRQIAPDDELVIFEYEPGIFKLSHLIPVLARLRFRHRKRIYLSIHELEPSKLPQYHFIMWRLNEPAWGHNWKEPYRWIRGVGDVVYRYTTMRLQSALMGVLPQRIIVHSPKGMANARMVTSDQSRLHYLPLVVKPLDGDRNGLRREFGLAVEPFAFIIPGFIFRRKRIIEVIDHLPAGAELWVVGTPSQYDPGYLEEIQSHLAQSSNRERVRIIQDYENMERYLLAADAVVLYYREIFQSASASLAVGARKPCILSDLPGFDEYRKAGIFVTNAQQLRQAMVDIQEPQRYRQLVAGAERIRTALSPVQMAAAYLE
jgi:glycosyltransferase involved in cell wall biosynthesis